MKKLLFIFSLSLMCNALLAQHTYKHSIVEGVLKMIYINNDNQSFYFNSTIEGSLNWQTVIILDISKQKFVEKKLYLIYKDESLNSVIKFIDEISNRGIYNDILNKCNYKYILFEVSYMTEDVEFINFIYKIDISDLKMYNGNYSFLKSIIKEYKN